MTSSTDEEFVGTHLLAASCAAINAMSGAEMRAAPREREERSEQFGKLLRHDVTAYDPQVQAVVDQMYKAVTAMWTPDRATFHSSVSSSPT